MRTRAMSPSSSIDPADPVLRVYRAAFPAMFRPIEAMPEGLVAHLRYPQDLFKVQVRTYAKYHMTVPQVFYNNEDCGRPRWRSTAARRSRWSRTTFSFVSRVRIGSSSC